MSETEITWPVDGFAPGDYQCWCRRCRGYFHGDKHALVCAECVVESLVAATRDLETRLVTVLNREAETQFRHDTKLAELERRIQSLILQNAELIHRNRALETENREVLDQAERYQTALRAVCKDGPEKAVIRAQDNADRWRLRWVETKAQLEDAQNA